MNNFLGLVPHFYHQLSRSHFPSSFVDPYANTAVFSGQMITNKYEINHEEINTIIEKIIISMNLTLNWNGEGTYPPSLNSVQSTILLLAIYNEFLTEFQIKPASIQGYPLNNGGFALEFITDQPLLILEMHDYPNLPDDWFKTEPKGIEFYITDENEIEEEGKTYISHIYSLFLRLHQLNNDL